MASDFRMGYTSFTLFAAILLLVSLKSAPIKAERHSFFDGSGEKESDCSEVLRHIDMLVRQYSAAIASEAHRDNFDEPFRLSRRRFTRPTG
uniref:EF HAND 1 calcium binding site n=1 Tax=Echinococcus granulosus TaxID=6210 RepID=A0A068WJN7_ECHGR|nr:EF HAND 1 calcium binding site [Echinococcus granulosus]